MEKTPDFEKDIEINKFKLDQECATHAGLYLYYSELAAEAANNVNVLDDNLKAVMGTANIEIRNKFTKAEMKFTEAVIASEVERSEKVITARESLRDAQYSLAKIRAGVSAFDHRKSQLDNLVRLYCAGYYSVPTAGGNARETVNDEVSRAARGALNKGRPRRAGAAALDDD
jgi:hypothetical protein